MNQKISEIQITPIKPNNGLVAFASLVINDIWYLGSIGIFTRPEGGYRLTYPTKAVANTKINIFYPINKIASNEVEIAVINKYEEVMKNYVRYSSFSHA
ncbi:septation protein SpoVG family protein [Candidatus Woesebacteria bacterium]|nr:septation protein SpoVG family protein [Candidatus Woesebacteria bacterium]